MFFLEFYYVIRTDLNKQNEYKLLDEFGKNLQNELFTAVSVESGYQTQIDIPQTLGNIQYNILMYKKTMVINASQNVVNFAIPNVTGTFKKGINNISNMHGVVCINLNCQ